MALLHAIDTCEREADALVADMSEEDVNWQEHPGQSWSVAQCLGHRRHLWQAANVKRALRGG